MREWLRKHGGTLLIGGALLGVLACGIWFDPDTHSNPPQGVPPTESPSAVVTALSPPPATDTAEPRRPPTPTWTIYYETPGATVIMPVETPTP